MGEFPGPHPLQAFDRVKNEIVEHLRPAAREGNSWRRQWAANASAPAVPASYTSGLRLVKVQVSHTFEPKT
ncbi:hypothetical protein JCM3263A_25600 [Thermobifida fusca]